MTLTHLSIRDYQSLAHVDLALSPFTVIVGPSSSGKSALTRAIRTLASYTPRGSSFVSTWAKKSMIAATTTKGSVTLWRGAKTEDNQYVIALPRTGEEQDKQTFTKMGGEVPEEVTRFLGIEPNSPLTFAGQFDRPYLLADSPAEIARTFAALTNVHTVFAAAREANRTRLERSTRLRTRLEDLAAATARKDEFKALQARVRAQNTAEAHAVTARGIDQAITTLHSAYEDLTDANIVISRAAAILAWPVPDLTRVEALSRQIHDLDREANRLTYWTDVANTAQDIAHAPLPSTQALEDAHHALEDFKRVLRRIRDTKQSYVLACHEVDQAEHDLATAQAEHTAALQALGHCPTCGQGTSRLPLPQGTSHLHTTTGEES